MWDGMRYHTLAWELKQRFGERLGKLSLDGGFTCPNRDGTLGRGGCIFCSAGGSGDFSGAENRKVDHAKPPLCSSPGSPFGRAVTATQ